MENIMNSRSNHVLLYPCMIIAMTIMIGGRWTALAASVESTEVDSSSLTGNQDEEGVRITAPAKAAMENLRRAYRSSAGISVKITGHSRSESGTFSPIKTSLLIAASGDVKLISPSYNLTHQRGVIYADSAYFPGYIVKERVPRAPDAAVAGLQSIWPLSPLPIEIRIRLASSAESAFAPLLKAIGNDGVVGLSVGVWPDGTPAQALRFQGGKTDIVVWIDPNTNLVRGVRGRIEDERGVTTINEAREVVANNRTPPIVVTTQGRAPISSFDALRTAWDKIYSSPPPPGVGGE